MPSPPWRPQRPKPPHERDRDRDRPDLDDPHTRLVVVLFAAVAMWLVWLASQAALADAATSKIGAPRQLSPANLAPDH